VGALSRFVLLRWLLSSDHRSADGDRSTLYPMGPDA